MKPSPLERYLSTSDDGQEEEEELIPGPSSSSSATSLDLEDICALRTRSIQKFCRALESISDKYIGDGNEESDDVVDLNTLEVIEDRGYIINRLDVNKGKLKVIDPTRLELLELLNQDQDQDQHQHQHQDLDQEWSDQIEDIEEEEETDHDYSSDDDDISIIELSSYQKPQQVQIIKTNSLPSPIPFHDTQNNNSNSTTITNALFERLKKRVLEKSSDIYNLKLTKEASSLNSNITSSSSSERGLDGFSSPSSSLITSTSLSSVLTTTESMISPYLQRLLQRETIKPNRTLPSGALITPSTLRRKSTIYDSAKTVSNNKRTRTSSESSSSSPHSDPPLSLFPASSSPSLSTLSVSSKENHSFRPTLLFRNPTIPPLLHQPTRRKKLKLVDLTSSRPKSFDIYAEQQNSVDDDDRDRKSRESSEDPLQLIPSSSSRKSRQKKIR
ncbi:hypothetical protein PSTG_06650 [Puccinia striiformis f. sp. tritici PST-78]|uniref:Uncharacterized protein n=1 Tax=Puccinia striiformis f. sp. tritici PST-78 TaxID=1165861 RepID=A0A0L0VLE7_9BASI|nr:hypothetical protein PSTG_06650 [Puccinia striiformis f. sp. tritici PST-78]